ncbi:kinase domain protein (macronuclear) [Tetrahymena thermophila SB210]|uniref:Kinase domain protein n=1 Tax=Tetrahymena thermophila (strain SB210) TaxID=312017 RepID=Q22PN4_TETTS|nr:kinase domain protein [Tetrahymena thermophila SB210]EAR87255.3 kinase domain protein [Tetrahymena thermophila SB210]|eukprot:XP_001007500.3 kinase domain protein [Tetrahymena thermophila SB210]
MSSSKQVKQEVEKQIKNCTIKKQNVRKFFKLMEEQQKHYQILEFAGNGSFALVLKAINKNTGQTVALKVVECDENDLKGIQAIQEEYKMLEIFTGCKYVVKVLNNFFLTESSDSDEDDDQIPVGQNNNQSNLLRVFYVMEQEFCQTTLQSFIETCRQKNSYPSQQMKEIMTIQILDSVAFLHRFDVVHRDIKPSNFLLNFDQNGNPTLKLCDLAFASALKNNETRLSISTFKGSQAYTAPEVYQNVYKKLSDLFSVGIVLLELDNIATFDISKTNLEQKFETKNGQIFQNFNIDRQSQIYKIVMQCLKYEVDQRKPAVELLIQFIVQNQQYLNVDVFTLLNKSQLKQKAEQFNQIQMSIIQDKKKNESETLKLSQVYHKDLHLEKLIKKYQQLERKPFETQEYQIILNYLQKMTKFDPNFEFISVGATGLVLGVFNKTQNRYSALKIQRAKKHEVVREVGIMKDCQMPLVIKFYDYFYLNVNNKEDFVVYEIEKCSGNLKQFLNNLKKQNKELDENQKIKIAIQIMDVINYLHIHDIVHRDIKLENLLYVEQDPEIPTIKLADFDQARKMPYDWSYIDGQNVKQYYPIEGACGTIGYCPPELVKDFLYSFNSDIFQVGVCLALIDNFETLEPVLVNKSLDYLNNFSIPFEVKQHNEQEVVKRNTKIYDILLQTIVFKQHKRSNLSLILDGFSKKGYQYHSKVNSKSNQIISSIYQRVLSLNYPQNNLSSDGAKAVASEIAKCTNLSTLTLSLQVNSIGSDGAKAVASEIAKCTNLSTLSLNLGSNNIGSDGAKAVASEIAKCTNLSTLSLNLSSNNIGSDGAKAFASKIAKYTNLSTLTLDLGNNNIGSDGAKAVASKIAKYTNLSTLSLDFYSNNIGSDGAKEVASEIAKCTNLSTLSLWLQLNSIGSNGAKAVASKIAKYTNLSTLSLNLQFNNIGSDGAKAVASEIAKCTNLSTLSLNLRWSSIGSDGAKAVASEIAKCTNLSTLSLNLSNNNIGSDGAKEVASEIAKCTNLSTLSLNLGWNSIGSDGAKVVASEITKCTDLSTLSLDFQFRWGERSCFRNSQMYQSLHFKPLALVQQDRFRWGESSCFRNSQMYQSLHFKPLAWWERHRFRCGESSCFRNSQMYQSLHFKPLALQVSPTNKNQKFRIQK